MRRSQVLVLLALASGLMSVLLAVAVNVATGGRLPGALAGYGGWAWPAVGVLGVVTVGLAFWQQHLQDRARQVALVGLSRAEPPARPSPSELPDLGAYFTGRSAELAELRRLVADGAGVVAIAGTAGIGKSALALQLARSLRGAYPDGQLYVRLRGASSEPAEPSAVLARFLDALGAPEPELRGDVDALAARYRTRLAGRRVLVLLDDAGDSRQIRPLLPGQPGCLAIVTSRPLLADMGEATLYDLAVMGEPEARALLAALVGEDRLAAEPEATAAVLKACGYLPLAVGIAGGRLRGRPNWTVAALAARLSDERHRLDELRLGHKEVRASFAGTYADLPDADRRVFRRLGAHPGAELGAGAAAALAGDDPDQVGAALERLADVRLVEVAAAGRYWRHDLTRLFAAERLAAEETAADADAAFARLVDWYAEGCAGADPAWLRTEWENLLATLRRAVETGMPDLAWRLIEAMTPLLEADTYQNAQAPLWTDIPFWTHLVEAAGDDEVRRARGLLALARAYDYTGYVEPALEHAAAALAACDALDDPLLRANAHKAMGDALRNAGRSGEAVDQYERALERYRALGRPEDQANVLDGLGTLHIVRHENEAAFVQLERAAQLRREVGGDPSKAAWTELLLGVAHMQFGRLAEARACVDRAIAGFIRLGDRGGEAYALREHGWLAWNEMRYGDAVRLHADAERLFTQIGLPVGVALAQESGGDALLAAGDAVAAATAYERSAAAFGELGDRGRGAISLLKLAEAWSRAGQHEAALARRAEAEPLLAGTDSPEADTIRARLDAMGVPPPQDRPEVRAPGERPEVRAPGERPSVYAPGERPSVYAPEDRSGGLGRGAAGGDTAGAD